MAEDAKFGNKIISKTRSANNLLLNMAEDTEIDGRVMETMMKRPKDYFLRNWADLHGILPSYIPTLIVHPLKKDELS